MNVIRWEDPPANTNGTRPRSNRGTWEADLAAELRAHPGEWALVWEGQDRNEGASLAIQIAPRTANPFHSFETARRTRRGDICRVYARYIGEAGAR